jgi:hypothetical protein
LAVAVIVMVTGAGPQLNVMIPPAATAATTALDVQLAGVPLPIRRVGWEVSTALASAGTLARPAGLPGLGRAAADGAGATDFDGDGDGLGAPGVGTAGALVAGPATNDGAGGAGLSDDPHPAVPVTRASTTTAAARLTRTRRC